VGRGSCIALIEERWEGDIGSWAEA
jgi:hypothetical protein